MYEADCNEGLLKGERRSREKWCINRIKRSKNTTSIANEDGKGRGCFLDGYS